MKRRTLIVLVASLALSIPLLVFLSMPGRFLPERTQTLDEDAPGGQPEDPDATAAETMTGSTVLGEGSWQGKAGHSASGTVQLLQVGERHYLRFIDYEMTSGPMVYLYLTPSDEADSEAEIDAGVRILIDGGADGGEATKRGTFNQLLPAGLDVSTYHGVAAWCDDFSVPFATAALA